MPAANRNNRWQFQDDLTKTKGRHSFKFGVYLELDSKTEPGTTNYMGNFNFGSTTTNPLDTGNGYANALLGIFQTYPEANKRVDKDVRHWQNEFYAQDSWKVKPRFTLDYGMRFTHSGPFYEIHHATAAFYPELYNAAKAPRLYAQACTNPAIAGESDLPDRPARRDRPGLPEHLRVGRLRRQLRAGHRRSVQRHESGRHGQTARYLVPARTSWAAPRVGFAWDVTGDGKTAVRSSFGVFYNFPRGQPSQFVGTPPVSVDDDDPQCDDRSAGELLQRPAGRARPAPSVRESRRRRASTTVCRSPTKPTWRSSGTSASPPSLTSPTSAISSGTTTGPVNLEPLPLYVYADPKNQFNGAEISANYLRTKFPAWGTSPTRSMTRPSLQYNSLQFSVQRRLSKGLQMGMAYTLAKGMGMQGYDDYTADPNITMANVGGTAVTGGDDALRARYWGPTAVDRRHNLVVNYSYQIPDALEERHGHELDPRAIGRSPA